MITVSGRLRRRLGIGRNPLRRPVDRVQRAVGAALLLAFLIAAPVVAVRLAAPGYGDGVRAEHAEAVARHRVDARVERIDERPKAGTSFVFTYAVLAWARPDGTVHRDTTQAWAGAKRGERRSVWVDEAGRLAPAPRDHARTAGVAVLTGAAGALAAGLAPLAAYLVVRRRCDRRRRDLWDAGLARLARDPIT
ncbi:hypothetical protein BTM25_10760 [Actinomadura rubteroloni]|uniref:Uncharacterized protein n=1 Tax=Actinomadura rubteroloni TaxID=1926885 RepID=A0A2P4UNR4_9ACTN|nr:hypothetical protein [Actinomadura rubteroloni]POM26672.1 hypothetical protein BTM25_10760 [Actinomadura rubteroloni]